LADFLLDPVEVAELFERAREACRADLARAFGSPDALAAIAIARVFSPWKDRQSVLGLGTEGSIAALAPADVEQWLTQLRNTRDTALIVTGPHDVALAEDWALVAFARWPQTQIRRRSGATKVLPRDRTTIFVPTSDMQQTLIVVGGLRPRPEDADAPAFEAGHDLFGGAVTQVLREERQLSYGTHGLWEEDDAFSLAIRVRADKTRVALKEINRALEEIPDLPTAHWLDLRRVAGSVALMDGAQDSDALGDVARRIFLRAHPLDALQVQMKALHLLDDNALSRSIEQHFHPSRLRIVVVGDPKRMKDQLDKFVEWTPETLLGS
jgi:predicted Zn-dependent peptidase